MEEPVELELPLGPDPEGSPEDNRSKRPKPAYRKDIFSATVHWKELEIPQAGGCSEVTSAINGVSEIASHIISEATRKSYTQVYNQIFDYSRSLNPPVDIDIAKESIPPAIILSYMRVLFTGAGKVVKDEQGNPLYCNDGTERLGRGLALTTFRKQYHALRTLHVHFQQDNISKRAFRGYLKMMKNPEDCKKVDRSVDGPVRARIFEISQLLEMYKASRQYSTGPMLRAWTYILISCCLFLRKSEAVNLKIGDIEVPCDRASGEQLTENGLPKYLFVHIRRSKTDQDSAGMVEIRAKLLSKSAALEMASKRLMLRRNLKDPKLCPVISLMTWLAVLKIIYKVKGEEQAVFCNLTQAERGKTLVKETFAKMLSTLIEKSGVDPSGLRTHSCRRTAAYYAAWLGIPEATIKLCGRWNSTVYLCYVEAADLDRRNWEDTKEPGEKDPIREHFDVFGHLTLA